MEASGDGQLPLPSFSASPSLPRRDIARGAEVGDISELRGDIAELRASNEELKTLVRRLVSATQSNGGGGGEGGGGA